MFKRMQVVAATLVVFSFLLATPISVGAQAPAPTTPAFTISDNARALSALAAMYAPGGNDETFWANTICSGMSEGGCGYFKNHLESMLWQKGQKGAIAGDGVSFIGVVGRLADGSQVWKLTVTIFTQSGSPAFTVFAHVVEDRSGRSVLNRVLYGPYINL